MFDIDHIVQDILATLPNWDRRHRTWRELSRVVFAHVGETMSETVRLRITDEVCDAVRQRASDVRTLEYADV